MTPPRPEDVAEQRRIAAMALAGRHEEVIDNLRRDVETARRKAVLVIISKGRVIQ